LDVDLPTAFVERRVTTSGTTGHEAGMAEIGVKELKATASAVIDRVEDGAAFVVTRRGRPAAVLMPVEEAEDLVLANADEYVRMRRAARAAYAAGTTVDLAELA
jgi:prevent-host-death family protein